jgi:hypothetical protein
MTAPPLYDARMSRDPVALDDHARETLRYIRSTMESAGSFTGIPGRASVAVGFLALVATALSLRTQFEPARLAIWLTTAAICIPVGLVAMISKARRSGGSLLSGPGRRFVLAWAPPIAVSALLTLPLVRVGELKLIPAVWLLLYGTAIVTGGAFSIRPVVGMGIAFLLLGTAAVFAPGAGQWLLGAGFGLLHILFGYVIWRHHGG